VLAVDLDRRQQAGYGARGQDRGHERPAAEPACGGVLNAGRNALKGQFKAVEVIRGQRFVQHAAQRLD
jgi:hypothetical protein